MSVIVKGMEMPGSCYQCNFCVNVMDGEDLVVICTALEKEIIALMVERQDDCPLVEIPPHGRLIDTDSTVEVELYDDEHEEWKTKFMSVETYLGYCGNKVPTIIEADGKDINVTTKDGGT